MVLRNPKVCVLRLFKPFGVILLGNIEKLQSPQKGTESHEKGHTVLK